MFRKESFRLFLQNRLSGNQKKCRILKLWFCQILCSIMMINLQFTVVKIFWDEMQQIIYCEANAPWLL